LSIQVGAELLEEFANGVFFVALASISDPDLVASAIAQTLGIKEIGNTPITESLKQHLRGKQLLLLLDNFEQILGAAPLIAELLAASGRLKILVTSRACLHIRGEHEFPVRPLTVPDLKQLPSPEELVQYAAVELFVERARAVKPDFAVTEESASAVAEVCARLDGLPLAIELAAARAKLLSPHAMLARLENRLQLLTGGARDLPAHKQTMRKTIQWSYELLDDEEKKLFRRLAVFVGGCSLEAAESVCTGTGDLPIDVFDGLTSLVDKSLLYLKEPKTDESRFLMLETIKEYGLEQLTKSGESDALQQLHAEYFLSLAEEAEPKIWGREEAAWFDQLEQEHDNLRKALEWSFTREKEAELGLKLAGTLWRFWWARGHLREGSEWLEKALSRAGSSATARIKALFGASWLSWLQGDFERVRLLSEECLELSREAEDKQGIARSLRGLGRVATIHRDYAGAESLFEEALPFAREAGDEIATAELLNSLGEVARYQGDYGRARALYEQSLAVNRETGNQLSEVSNLVNLGLTALAQGDVLAASLFYKESLGVSPATGDKQGIIYGLEGMAAVCTAQQELERAARLFGAAKAQREAINLSSHYDDLTPIDRAVSAARIALGKEAFAAAWAQGREMTVEQAIIFAREESPVP
jgi:predicted ATPase